MRTIFKSGLIAVFFGVLSAAGAQTVLESIRVFTTEPASFETRRSGISLTVP
jgi:hypothetical protein